MTIPLPRTVRIVEILALPKRRGPASIAQQCYRILDPEGGLAIAADKTTPKEGNKRL